ncbi:MAG: hypothetical protein H0W48_00190 [Methylibium sp.]|nr:hypothetical protein [Methylibium sp.]
MKLMTEAAIAKLRTEARCEALHIATEILERRAALSKTFTLEHELLSAAAEIAALPGRPANPAQ